MWRDTLTVAGKDLRIELRSRSTADFRARDGEGGLVWDRQGGSARFCARDAKTGSPGFDT